MALIAPFFGDFDALTMYEKYYDDKIQTEIDERKEEIYFISNIKKTRAHNMELVRMMDPSYANGIEDMHERLLATENEMITNLVLCNKLAAEVHEREKTLSCLRRKIELMTTNCTIEQKFSYLMQIEYRKLFFMITDYIKFLSTEIQEHHKTGKTVPQNLIDELDIHRQHFRTIRNVLKEKHKENRRIFELNNH